ncbi:NAD(P)H-hydrate epimerase [Mesobaculum littorinae]|uniref:Bifunctional NAD(P)H-hydrate repair enzyme n=1 Tax=Mesobaculum littorinae TaxID=2486419 RepID=A0A438AIU8_9RHOB|nr:NAD(P)H-hydrate epimerase [Mesobaculum littorinae]RVV98584.1 NAD(P)H-hydrate epimerase [Mesobaculum littorinae]
MSQLLTAAEMRDVEAAAIATGEVTGAELMARAGAAVVAAIRAEWEGELPTQPRAVVLAGPGNNGGDGFAIARGLRDLGWSVRVLLAGQAGALPPDARAQHDRWAAGGAARGAVLPLTLETLRDEPAADIYVDALFGIGLGRPLGGDLARVVAHLAGADGTLGLYQPRMVAVDVPSGLDADSGRVPGDPAGAAAVRARLTVTFDSPKPGHYLGHGPDLCGRLVVADIGLAHARARQGAARGLAPARTRVVPPLGIADPRRSVWPDIAGLLTKRQGHKYQHGHAMVLTGGVGRGGAARMAAKAALRIGAGAVTLGCPPAAVLESASHVDALMLHRVPDAAALTEALSGGRITALCLGPGLGTGEREAALVGAALDWGGAVLLDADAITLMAGEATLAAKLHDRCLLTPHPGEFRRLFPDIAGRLDDPDPSLRYDEAADADAQARSRAAREDLAAQRGPMMSTLDAAREAAAHCGATVLLKGPATAIAAPSGAAVVHRAVYDRAAPWLATAGAGDVLAGLACGLLARGLAPPVAAELAAQIHVDAALSFGPGLTAEDLPRQVPQVLARYLAP